MNSEEIKELRNNKFKQIHNGDIAVCEGCDKIIDVYIAALPHFPVTVAMCKSCWESNVIPDREFKWLKHKIDTHNKTQAKQFIPSKKYYKKTIIFSREVIDKVLVTTGNFTTIEDITHESKELKKNYGDF